MCKIFVVRNNEKVNFDISLMDLNSHVKIMSCTPNCILVYLRSDDDHRPNYFQLDVLYKEPMEFFSLEIV